MGEILLRSLECFVLPKDFDVKSSEGEDIWLKNGRREEFVNIVDGNYVNTIERVKKILGCGEIRERRYALTSVYSPDDFCEVVAFVPCTEIYYCKSCGDTYDLLNEKIKKAKQRKNAEKKI